MPKITAKEIEAAEKAKEDRIRNRKGGFSLMSVRDKGWQRLGNGIVMLWPTAREPLPGEALTRVPEGMFLLDIGEKIIPFDAEEFRKYLRWV